LDIFLYNFDEIDQFQFKQNFECKMYTIHLKSKFKILGSL